MANFPLKSYAKGEVIIHEGAQADMAYFIKEGSVDIVINKDNQQMKLANLKAGSYTGELELILKDKKRLASVVAAEDCKLSVIDEKHFRDCVNRSPAIVISLLNAVSDRLWNTTSMLASLHDVFLRVCELLNLLAFHSGGDIATIETQEVLSKAFNVPPEHINEVFEVLETMNFIERLERSDGMKTIRILGKPKEFLPKVMRVNQLFRQREEKKP